MRSNDVPGYKDLFTDGNDKYDNLVSGISSEMIIRVCSALNNELNGSGGMAGAQVSILRDFTQSFTTEQKQDLLNRLKNFQDQEGQDKPVIIFGTRYLLTMVIKELNNFRKDVIDTNEPMEYALFKAYLLVIDEVAANDHSNIDFKLLKPKEPQNLLRIMWLPIITQFEFNEHSSPLFETFKSLCFFKHLQNSDYRPYLKEYLTTLHLKNVGAYLGTFNQINSTIQDFDPNAKMLKRLNYIVPNEGVDQTHLRHLSVNLEINDKYALSDLKKKPLIYASDRKGYMVVDYNYSHKKMFRGAFFEIVHNTSLTNNTEYSTKEKQVIFDKYNQQASDVFEKKYFKPIIELLGSDGCDIIYFDSGIPNAPDAYIRIGHNVLLLEFKASSFKEDLAINPNFDELIAYLNNRFVKSEKNKQKGVGQLIEQIELFHAENFKFDPVGIELLKKGELHFYPVIVYNDFNFSMPAINAHLNQSMWKLVENKPQLKASIKPLVMLNLETIMDIAITGGKAADLGTLFCYYFQFLLNKQQFLNAKPTVDNLMGAHCSFDEFYRAYIEKPRVSDHNTQGYLHRLLELSDINFDEFNNEL